MTTPHRHGPVRVVFLTSEVVPFSKTGGLADVAAALPAQLRAAGVQVATITPAYRSVLAATQLTPREDLAGKVGGHQLTVWEDSATATLFLAVGDLFDREGFYDHPDDHLRFSLFTRAALQVAATLDPPPDLIHANDWQTALAPLLLKLTGDSRTRTVLTIHNLGYQGTFSPQTLGALGLDPDDERVYLREGWVNFLALGIVHATRITTVSPTYAREIQTPEGGAGLDGLLRARSEDLVGILNGIDTAEWNPRTDPHLPFRYSEKSLWRKEKDKEALLRGLGLHYRKDVPVLGIVSRLVWQKGFDIVASPLTYFLDTWDCRLVVLGTGEARYEELFSQLVARYPHKVSFTAAYDNRLAHLIEAGADLFLMPSLYEPCGLNQMYSLAYGTAPVVRKVGGLADTVTHFDPTTGRGTGFVFEHFTEDGLGWVIGQGLTTHLKRDAWRQLQANAMAEDNSWERRAGEYLALYEELLAGSGRRS